MDSLSARAIHIRELLAKVEKEFDAERRVYRDKLLVKIGILICHFFNFFFCLFRKCKVFLNANKNMFVNCGREMRCVLILLAVRWLVFGISIHFFAFPYNNTL